MSEPLLAALDAWLEAHGDDLVAFRRTLHAHPELSFEEHLTTEAVAERLRVAGLTCRVFSSGTGLVCDIGAAPRLALRADLDALAMDDEKDVSYRSQVPGVAHACGHDVHTTVVLGAGLYLAHHLNGAARGVRLIFQPAEELVPGGAPGVIDDGGLESVVAITGVHCDPRLTVGRVGLRAGAITSAADKATITLEGPGGHTARPEETVDMVSLAARLVLELPERVRSHLVDPDALKFVFGAMRSGDAANVIPSHAQLRASIRTPSQSVWERLPELVEAEVTAFATSAGAQCTLDYTRGVPAVINDGELVRLVDRAVSGALGADAVTDAVQSWGGDDFAWYTQHVPAAYVRLGTRSPDATGPPLDLHAGHFDVDESAIPVGVRVLVATVAQWLAEPI